MLIIFCILKIRNYFVTGLNEIFETLRLLIRKEIAYIENFKKDKNSEKDLKFMEITQSSSRRFLLELSILKLINENCIRFYEETRNDNYITTLKEIINLFLEIFDKSTDNDNIVIILVHITRNVYFIIDNEALFYTTSKVSKFNNGTTSCESIVEKLINVLMNLLRKNPYDEELCNNVILALIKITKRKPETCNTMVKAGCPRLLLQITENTNNPTLTINALILIKIISLSSEENLNIVSNQNILEKLNEIYTKFSNNEEINNICNSIINELIKLPHQEKIIKDIILSNLNYIHECVSDNTIENDNKYTILSSLEKLNTFCQNENYITLLTKNPFPKDLNVLIELTLLEKDISDLNEKLLNNEMSLSLKIYGKDAKYDPEIIKGIISDILKIMKDKSHYRDIYLNAARLLRTHINDDLIFEPYLKSKLDKAFIDQLFDTQENYLDDMEVSKEINNILCSLCLKNEELSLYIVQKGGLVNVIDELRSLIGLDDEVSKSIKVNSLKFIHSLVKDKEIMKTFVKVNGCDLINNLVIFVLNGAQPKRYPYATIDTFNYNVNKPEHVKDEITYCIKILYQTLKQGHKFFDNLATYKNTIGIIK
jgi:hypothetical protein